MNCSKWTSNVRRAKALALRNVSEFISFYIPTRSSDKTSINVLNDSTLLKSKTVKNINLFRSLCLFKKELFIRTREISVENIMRYSKIHFISHNDKSSGVKNIKISGWTSRLDVRVE